MQSPFAGLRPAVRKILPEGAQVHINRSIHSGGGKLPRHPSILFCHEEQLLMSFAG